MAHEKSTWKPKGATETYKDFEVFDGGIWPGDVNQNDTIDEDDHDHDE